MHSPDHVPFLTRLRRAVYGFRRDRRGVTAVEFGIIAIPFFALKLAIIETALVFWAGQILENGTSEASRLIRTGQVQTGSMSKADFRATICGAVGNMFDCAARLHINVTRYTDFNSAVTNNRPVDATGNFAGGESWQPGVGGDIIVVQAFYLWPLMFSIGGFDMSDVSGRQRLLVSTMAFQNEPF